MNIIKKMEWTMRKFLMIMIAALLVFGMAACSGSSSDAAADSADNGTEAAESTSGAEDAEAGQSAGEAEGAQSGSDTLVVYFSATGNTRGVAEKIAAVTGADIYEIKAAQEYTDADLDWNDSDSRTTHEQNDASFRPEIGSDPVSLEGYTTIYIGYPIWWGEEPRIMDTFVESYDFSGITMIPFCTSGGSGIGMSGKNLESNAGSGKWLEGDRLNGSASEEELKAWIDGLQ